MHPSTCEPCDQKTLFNNYLSIDINNLLILLTELNNHYSNSHANHWNAIYLKGLSQLDKETRINQVISFCKQSIDEILYAFEFTNVPPDKITNLQRIINNINSPL